MARVRICKLTKKFGKVIAVKSLNLDIADREFLVLLGPSGCGKTTTLRCIAGLEHPDEGEIYIGDALVNDVPPKDRDIAMVFQSYALYPHMTVFDNIAFPLKMRKVPKDEIVERVKRTAEFLKISHLLNRRPAQLSGGEAQRVALGRAIVREPKVFLMDEPLSNLDAKLRVYMRAELKRLQRELKTTTIYVTHDQVEAMSMADRVAIMSGGVLQQVGTPEEIYSNPRNIFVAGFIGSPPMNFIDCTFIEREEGAFLEASTFTLPIPDTVRDAIKERATGPELVLGVRPEDIKLYRKQTPSANISGQVYVVEPLGSELIYDLKIEDSLVKAKAPSDFKVEMGEKIWLSFSIEKIHIFDKRTEETII